MITAVAVTLPPMQIAQRRRRSLIGEAIGFPATRAITLRLLLGSAIFGVGWGMTGLCPGPSLASLAALTWQEWLFFASMVAGMVGFEIWQRSNSRRSAASGLAAAQPRG